LAARANNGRNPAHIISYVAAALAFPCISHSRRRFDLTRSPWTEFPLSARDVEGWILYEDQTKILIKSLEKKVGKVSGKDLREHVGTLKSIFQDSEVERSAIDALLRRVHVLLTNEAELLAPFLVSAAALVRRRVLSVLQPASLPLGVNGSEADKQAVGIAVNRELDAFLYSMDAALRWQHYGPLNSFGLTSLDMAGMANIIWLTGGSSASLLMILPSLKQHCYKNCMT